MSLSSLHLTVSFGLMLIASVPDSAGEECLAFSSINWTIPPEEVLVVDPEVRLQLSVWGSMIELGSMESRIREEGWGVGIRYPETTIIPIFDDKGLLIIEQYFDTLLGQAIASDFAHGLCEKSLKAKLSPHGWQVSYANDVIDGSYSALPLKADK